jgi:hypothetical protein
VVSWRLSAPPTIAAEFIMLSNERFALACRAYYEEIGLIVDSSNGQFAHSPLTRKECDTGYYLLWEHHQHQGLLQSKDLDKCCFFSGDTKKWLLECDYFPADYFELWDIFEKYFHKNKKKVAETNRKNKTAIFSPEAQKKRTETQIKNKTGIFDPETWKKSVETCRTNGAGLFDPEIRKKGAEARKKPIELTKISTGDKFVFPSKKEAAEVFNLCASNLSNVCLGKRSHTNGFTARYL